MKVAGGGARYFFITGWSLPVGPYRLLILYYRLFGPRLPGRARPGRAGPDRRGRARPKGLDQKAVGSGGFVWLV